MSKPKKVFLVKREYKGEPVWASSSGWTTDIRKAKTWYRKQDAGMSVMARSVSGGPKITIVEFEAREVKPDQQTVSLPKSKELLIVLGDLLEQAGYLEAANQIREQASLQGKKKKLVDSQSLLP